MPNARNSEVLIKVTMGDGGIISLSNVRWALNEGKYTKGDKVMFVEDIMGEGL